MWLRIQTLNDESLPVCLGASYFIKLTLPRPQVEGKDRKVDLEVSILEFNILFPSFKMAKGTRSHTMCCLQAANGLY